MGDPGQVHTGERFASFLAYLISPPILPPVLIGIVLHYFGAAWKEVAVGVGITLIFFSLIPLLYVLWMIRDQREVTVELRRRELRPIPFLVGIVSYALSIPLYFVAISTAFPLILAIVGMHIFNTFVITLITLRWKISIHVIALAGFFSILFFITQMPGQSLPVSFLDVPVLRRIAQFGYISLLSLLMWARVRAGAHTSRQVWAGALFGLFVPYIELFVLYRTGIL